MLRFKLLSAQGTGEEKNISLWLKRLRTRKENRGEDKLWGLGGRGALQNQMKSWKKVKLGRVGGVRVNFWALRSPVSFSLFKKMGDRINEKQVGYMRRKENRKKYPGGHFTSVASDCKVYWEHFSKPAPFTLQKPGAKQSSGAETVLLKSTSDIQTQLFKQCWPAEEKQKQRRSSQQPERREFHRLFTVTVFFSLKFSLYAQKIWCSTILNMWILSMVSWQPHIWIWGHISSHPRHVPLTKIVFCFGILM